MLTPLHHLIEESEYDCIEPQVERAALDSLLRRPRSPREEVVAKTKSAAVLLAAGMQVSMSDEEETEALRQFHRETQQLPIRPPDRPAVILKLAALLSEYDHEVVKDATQMRQYVTNRLLEESDPKQPASQRLAALRLLGQITEVGLFTERTEITVKQMPVETLEAKLHEKLKLLLPSEVEVTDVTPTAPNAAPSDDED